MGGVPAPNEQMTNGGFPPAADELSVETASQPCSFGSGRFLGCFLEESSRQTLNRVEVNR